MRLVGTDVLGDATGLAHSDVRISDRVKELGFTVVNVSHDGHYRRTLNHILRIGFLRAFCFKVNVEGFENLAIFVFRAYDLMS